MAITITNSANVTYNHGSLTDATSSNTVTTLLDESYSLKAVKTSHNTSWKPSENLTFVITVENDGSEPLYGVSVQDNLGGNTDRLLDYIAGSAKMFKNNVLTGITPTSVDPLTLVIPNTIVPGEVVVLSYVAKVRGDIESSITEITNEATVAGHEVSVSGPTVTVDPAPSLTIPKADYADVRVEKMVDKKQISSGENLTYTFRLENSGNIEATNIVIRDDLPAEFVVNSIVSETNGIRTTFDATDYSLDVDNKLVLPTSVTKTISVPASTELGVGVTTVTIIGTITV